MSMNTPIGNITQTTPIKDFKELDEMQNEQYLLGIDDNAVGNGSKISLENLINSSISAGSNNLITKGTDNKLLVNTPIEIGDLSNLSTTDKSSLVAAINEVDGDITTEATTRANADNNLQSQIDAITAASDVTDIVGTYAELQAYDTTGLADKSVIKVLQDESRENETTYYRWVITGGVGAWVSIGEEGPYYTISQADSKFATQATVGNLSNLATSDKSSIVNAMNELASVLDPTQTADYIKNSKAIYSGEISENALILPQIKEMAHSTFARSKFTVVGSPVITDDGIASGFSNENYITVSQFDTTKPYKINFEFTTFSTMNVEQYICRTAGPRLWILLNSRGYLLVRAGSTNYGSDLLNYTGTTALNPNTSYKLTFEYTGTQYKAFLDGNLLTTKDSTTALESGAIIIGALGTASNFLGSIDLKQFSITVDGVEVFSGNKTGIDTIKPDDYTVVGTPTISADGVASGFTTSDYLTDNITLGSGEWDITVPYKTGSTNPNEGIIFYISACGVFYYNNDIYFSVRDGNSQHILNAHFTPNANTNYLFRLSYIGGTYKAEYSTDNDVTYNSLGTNTTSSIARDAATSQTFYIGGNTGSACNGSIDLNLLKIYIAEDLVYQPCLKIPYTESKTGSKIVDAVYRDRVIDMYDEFGYAPYYTLGDTDFTLPMGEIYGMIENAKRTGFLGEIKFSLDPLFNDGLHLLDGALLQGSGAYKPFIDNYIKPLYNSNPTRFVTETVWQQSVSDYGVCGYYVYDSVNNTVRLPKVTGFIKGTLDVAALGQLTEAYAPNITGWIGSTRAGGTGAFYPSAYNVGSYDGNGNFGTDVTFDASRSSAVYKNNVETLEPQSISGYLYILVANNVTSAVSTNQSGVITELNNKLDKDGSNAVNLSEAFLTQLMPDYSSGITISSFPYTAPANGFIDVGLAALEGTAQLYVNNIKIGHAYSSSNSFYSMISGQYRVKTGDVVTFTGGALQYAEFFPYV